MQNNTFQNTIVLRVGGREHHFWQTYSIDSDFLIPSDAFDLSIFHAPGFDIPDLSGEDCEVLINGQVVLTGIIDTQEDRKSKGSRSLRIAGRDLASLLVDCSAPQINLQGKTVLDAAKELVKPWQQIKNIQLKAKENPKLDKIDIEPGETVWQALEKIAHFAGLHPWFEPDGTLIIGGADYASEPVATLCWSKNSHKNNIQELKIDRSVENRYSEVSFLAQSHAKAGDHGKHDLKWVHKDESMALYKPKTVVISDADNLEALKKQAQKQLADWRLEGLTLSISVTDHKTASGVLWQPGQRVHVVDEEEGIDAIFFLMGRRFELSRSGGTTTELRLKEDGVWTPSAYPEKAEKARNRAGKKKGVRNQSKRK